VHRADGNEVTEYDFTTSNTNVSLDALHMVSRPLIVHFVYFGKEPSNSIAKMPRTTFTATNLKNINKRSVCDICAVSCVNFFY